MRKTGGRFVAVAAVGLLISAAAGAGEEKVALDKLPRAVAEAVKARFPGAELSGAGKETEDGKAVYEVTVKDKGRNVDVTLTPDGKIVEIEKQIAAKDLPRVVSGALDARYPGASFQIIEEVIKVKDGREKLEYYELLLVTAGKKKLEVQVTPEGKVAKVEDKGKEKGGDE